MAEGRILKRQISDSKKLGALKSDSPRLFYTWLIPWLDIEDRHTADPELIKGHLFPKCKDWNIRKIERHLEDLNEIGLIILYEIDGERYLQFTKTLQKKYIDKEAPSKIPPPPENSRELQRTPLKKKGKEREVKYKENIEQILKYLNEKTKKNFKNDSQDFISGRLNDGYILDNFKKVIDIKVAEWLNDPKMSKYLRPSTLFRKSNFEEYLNEQMPVRKPQVGESSYKPTAKNGEYQKARQTKLKELEKKYESEIAEARKSGDIAKLENIENRIKEELAEFSRNYHG